MVSAGILACFGPKIYEFYGQTLAALHENDKTIRNVSPNTVFPAMSFNFGPTAATLEHTDFQNYAGGFCIVTALGNFDPTRSAHLYVRELKLVFEFPAGASIMLPSALLHHGNTTLVDNDERGSITLYGAGSLFRWPDQGFQTDESMPSAKRIEFNAMKPIRRQEALDRFSKVGELAEDQDKVFHASDGQEE